MDMDRVGSKVGPRIAQIVVDATVATRSRMAPFQAQLAVHSVNKFLEQVTDEHQEHVGDVWGKLADHPEMPDWGKSLFGFTRHGKGQWSALIGHQLISTGVGAGIMGFISNELAPVTQAIVQASPNLALDPSVVAQATARRQWDRNDAVREASRLGINGGRFGHLVDLASTVPSPDVAISMFRRGLIGEAKMQEAFHDAGIRESWLAHMERSTEEHPSPSVLADMVVRTILTEEQGARLAAQEGMPADHFHRLVLDTGETLGLESLLAAFRRGFINEGRLRHGIAQSRVRTEWTDVIERLRFSPMSTGDALSAVVQNHLGDAAGQRIAEQNGLEPAHWRPLVETHGRPPGPETMIALWRRGAASEGEVDQAIRESDVKNKYIAALKKTRERLPEEGMVTHMLREGTVTEPTARHMLAQLGYSTLVIDGLVKASHKAATATHRALSADMVAEAYRDHLITRADAVHRLAGMGYPAADVTLRLELADARRAREETDAAVRVVRSQYVGRKITEHGALADLSTLDVPPARKDHLLKLWRLERAGTVRHLTEAQVASAVKRSVISHAEGLRRLEDMGYGPGDAAILLPAPVAR